EVLTEENRYRTAEAMERQTEMVTQNRNELDVYNAYQLLNERERNVFSPQYDASAGQIHTAAYLPTERKAFFAIGGNQMPVIFDINDFIIGKKTFVKQMNGKLEYHKPFVNMRKNLLPSV